MAGIAGAEGAACSGAPAILIFAARTALRDTGDTTHEGVRRCQVLLEILLAAARAGGFAQSDVLCTLIARGDVSERVQRMAAAAMTAAEANLAALAVGRAGFSGAGVDRD